MEPIPGLRGFSVVLVQGDLKTGATAGDSVPAAAAKALADLKDFLPYKSYRLLDTQWTMGSGHISGRLIGPEGRSYDLELETRKGTTDAPVVVSRFLLHDDAVVGPQGQRFGRVQGQQGQQAQQQGQGQPQSQGQQQGQQPQAPQGARQGRGVLQLYSAPYSAVFQGNAGVVSRGPFGFSGSRALIDTSFSMDIGETVVVGTSRLQGDTALIVLLTAVSRSGTARSGR